MIPDLQRLADTFLQIFQVSNTAGEWLMALAETEIDGRHKEICPVPIKDESPARATLQKKRSTILNGCRRPMEPSPDPSADLVQRQYKSGLVEANILFRGNSLLTKALDAHMKRLGRDYLKETLGAHLKRIVAEDIYCEVDPVRVDSPEIVERNWKVLLSLTRTMWQSIFTSAARCPLELRKILRHIRLCVEDRYGDLLRTISYSSVCGFLFLRFFCPAILNPKLFGLLKGACLFSTPLVLY